MGHIAKLFAAVAMIAVLPLVAGPAEGAPPPPVTNAEMLTLAEAQDAFPSVDLVQRDRLKRYQMANQLCHSNSKVRGVSGRSRWFSSNGPTVTLEQRVIRYATVAAARGAIREVRRMTRNCPFAQSYDEKAGWERTRSKTYPVPALGQNRLGVLMVQKTHGSRDRAGRFHFPYVDWTRTVMVRKGRTVSTVAVMRLDVMSGKKRVLKASRIALTRL